MNPLVLRLKEFMEHKRVTVLSLAETLGYRSPQKLYRLFNTAQASPSCQIIEDISNRYKDLNLNWLFTGEGEMILDKVAIENPISKESKERYIYKFGRELHFV